MSVRDGMITDFRSVFPTDPVSRAVDPLAGFQQDLPVPWDDERPLGVPTHGDVLRQEEAMRRDFDTCEEERADDHAAQG
jgi:hypothetical protein